jgi:PleD family two-component response regulator
MNNGLSIRSSTGISKRPEYYQGETMRRPRVLVADDHRIVSDGLRSLLADEFELVGIVEDGRALVAAAKKLQPE